MEVWFEDLVCRTSFSRKRKKLLDNVSGRFYPGELTAILGPSGAGKTTLLNAISGYRCRHVSGRMWTGSSYSCYLPHEDVLPSLLSAGELMSFASRLKLPSTYSQKQRDAVINNVVSSLGLEKCTDTRTECLSGGERKRLSIALELINNPPVLFLDEPTSGLDTVAAGQLIHLLSKLSRGDHTIITTIHQPSASLFDIFDRVYVLALGVCIYQGGPGPLLVDYLANCGFVCPIHHNPADFVIELSEERKNIKVLSEAAKNGKTSWMIENKNNVKVYHPVNSTLKNSQVEASYASFWVQFSTIFSRIMLQSQRNKSSLKLQILNHIGCSIVLGLLFFQRGDDGSEFFIHLKLIVGVILFHVYTMQMVPCLSYPFEVKILKKELFNHWYRLLPYYLAFNAAKAPIMLSLNLMYSTIIYAMIGIPWEAERFCYFLLAGVLTGLVAEAVGLTIGALFSSTNASAVGPLVMAPFVGLSLYGFDFMKSISPMMDILTQTSYVRSGVVSLALVQFGLERKRLACPEGVDYCLNSDPRQVTNFLTLDRFTIPQMMVHLIINLILFRFLFYLALKWRLRK